MATNATLISERAVQPGQHVVLSVPLPPGLTAEDVAVNVVPRDDGTETFYSHDADCRLVADLANLTASDLP